jgi:hypothetical protein
MPEGFYLSRELRDPKAKETRLARLEELETEIFERATGVLNAALAFAEITPTQRDPPQSWVDEYGEAAARQRLAIAKLGYLPTSVSPNGFKLAQQFVIGSMRGRAYRAKVTQNNLNVTLALPVPTTAAHPGPIAYEIRDVET